MKFYTKITYWENKRRLEKLIEFHQLVITYFNNSSVNWLDDERVEQEEAQKARVEINRLIDEVHYFIVYCGINPSIIYTPPRSIGGYISDIDIIQNIFHIHRYKISPNYLLDYIDRAIGIYERNSSKSLLRSFNPFFYLTLIFDMIVRVPFVFIGKLGFNREKAEKSFIGRFVKGLLNLIIVFASFLTALHLLGYLDYVKDFIGNISGSN